jgi:glycerol-3-phosphate dehydrogenase
LGAKFYEWLAGKNSLGISKYHSKVETLRLNPELSAVGLLGSVSYIDVQMNDIGLSEWLLKRAESVGVVVQTNTRVQSISTNGSITISNGESIKFTKVVNTCGPWAKQLLDDSRVNTAFKLALVKGSHLFVDCELSNPLVIQVPEDGRIIFAMPCEGKMLIGTTELKHEISHPIICSDQEVNYLLDAVGSILNKKLYTVDVIKNYAGVRPIVSSNQNIKELSKANREAAIETINNLTNVFGGKWTSAMRLGKIVSNQIIN